MSNRHAAHRGGRPSAPNRRSSSLPNLHFPELEIFAAPPEPSATAAITASERPTSGARLTRERRRSAISTTLIRTTRVSTS